MVAAAAKVPGGFKTVEQGAATSIWCATSRALDGMGGVYCEDCDIAPAVAPDHAAPTGVRPWACDPALAEHLWDASERWIWRPPDPEEPTRRLRRLDRDLFGLVRSGSQPWSACWATWRPLRSDVSRSSDVLASRPTVTERRARQFADAVAHKLVELVPGATVIAEDTALIIDGHRISLDGYISAYVDASWFGRRSVVRRTANAIADELAGYVLDSYDAALRALRARLTTDAAMDLLRLAYLGAPNSDSPARPVFRALGSDLVAEPILDRSHDLIRVHQWMLARWAVPEKELLDDAVRAMRSGELTFSDIGGLRACGPANAIFIVEAMLDHAAQDLPRSARELYADWTELFNFTPTRAHVRLCPRRRGTVRCRTPTHGPTLGRACASSRPRSAQSKPSCRGRAGDPAAPLRDSARCDRGCVSAPRRATNQAGRIANRRDVHARPRGRFARLRSRRTD